MTGQTIDAQYSSRMQTFKFNTSGDVVDYASQRRAVDWSFGAGACTADARPFSERFSDVSRRRIPVVVEQLPRIFGLLAVLLAGLDELVVKVGGQSCGGRVRTCVEISVTVMYDG